MRKVKLYTAFFIILFILSFININPENKNFLQFTQEVNAASGWETLFTSEPIYLSAQPGNVTTDSYSDIVQIFYRHSENGIYCTSADFSKYVYRGVFNGNTFSILYHQQLKYPYDIYYAGSYVFEIQRQLKNYSPSINITSPSPSPNDTLRIWRWH